MATDVPLLPTELAVKRSDAVYNAHGYLTKVPYGAIIPFIEAFTSPGETVLDLFAGSGMTGVASIILGRQAELRDISALGEHIGRNYTTLVDPMDLRRAAQGAIDRCDVVLPNAYATRCLSCGGSADLAKAVWSMRYACPSCEHEFSYFDAFETAGWDKQAMRCPGCQSPFRPRGATRVGEVPVMDCVRCSCSEKQIEQPHSPVSDLPMPADYPDLEIGEDRQMFTASGLKKHNLRSTAAFFSARNLAVLSALHRQIREEPTPDLRSKLLFAFTAILTRASKRYQWHRKRPLNASNQTYYIAPVFYEWNVYDLFQRKVQAAIRSDDLVRAQRAAHDVKADTRCAYAVGSADNVDLPDESVDYVFTDPPFGSQLFYSDMSLFHEAWLGTVTDHTQEAVIDRTESGGKPRSADRYEEIMVKALNECRRVLRPNRWLSMIFSNSNGEMWLLVQRAIGEAGFVLEHITLLDKGQRSVKGLASGFESIVTSDLILTMRKAEPGERRELQEAPLGALHSAVDAALNEGADTPTRVYLSVVTAYLRNEWKVTEVTISRIRDELAQRGYRVDRADGVLSRLPEAA